MVIQHAAAVEDNPAVTQTHDQCIQRDVVVTFLSYTPVLGGRERFRGALIGGIVRFGVLRDVATVGGLLGIWGVFSTEIKRRINKFRKQGENR